MLVESNVQTLSRLTSPTFYNVKILSDCGFTGEESAEALSKSIKATAVKLTLDLTTLSYVGKGQLLTQSCLQSVIDQLAQTQESLASGKKNQLQAQLASQKVELIAMEKSEKDISIALKRVGLSSSSPAESALALHGIQTKQNMALEARRLVIELEGLLLPPSTQKLTALEPIYVSSKPVSPTPLLFGFAGLFLGLFACAILCWREILALVNSDD